MAKARIDSNGDLVNSKTGEVIGNVQTGVNFSSRDGEMHSLEEMGVSLPDPPDEERIKSRFASAGEREKAAADAKEKEARKPGPPPATADGQTGTHIDSGVTSFPAKRTKYEITKDTFFVVRFGLMQMEDGRFVAMPADEARRHDGAESHWVKFRMWSYDEELRWKSECLEYNPEMKAQVINADRLNERKLRMLLLDWSFGECEDRLRLLHCDGRLSDESYSILKGMYPSIVNAIVTLMNNVLENNL